MTAVPAEDRPTTAPRGRRGFRPSMAATLPLGLGILILTSLGASLWLALDAARLNTFELERALAEVTVETVIHEVETQLGAAQTQASFLGTLIESGEVDARDEERLSDLMLGALAATPQVTGLAFVRSDFSVLRVGYYDGKKVVLPGDWSDRPEIHGAMEEVETLGQPHWRQVIWSDDFEAPHITMAAPVTRDGRFLGYIFPIVAISRLSDFLDRFDQAGGTRSFILYDRDKVIAHPALAGGFRGLSSEKPLPLLGDLNDPILAAIWNPAIDDMAYFLEGTDIDGHVVAGSDEDYIYFYRELELYSESPWTVGVYFRESEISGPLRRLIGAAVIGLAILVIAVIAGILLVRIIVPPIRRLADASQAVERLELSGVKPLGSSLFRELDTAAKAFDAMLAGLKWFETYVPRRLVLRLMHSGSDGMASEERQITVFFTDIVDFSPLGARLAPAALADLLNQHFALLNEAIEAEGGTIDKYIGDSVMAFWGAPEDQPDHAARACRAALRIARTLREDNRRRQAAGEAPIRLRVGIHSGTAVVGNIGAPGRVNYTLVGDTVNVAQRLEGLGKDIGADPDADAVILVSDETRAELTAEFALDTAGSHRLRGHSEAVIVYRLVTR